MKRQEKHFCNFPAEILLIIRVEGTFPDRGELLI